MSMTLDAVNLPISPHHDIKIMADMLKHTKIQYMIDDTVYSTFVHEDALTFMCHDYQPSTAEKIEFLKDYAEENKVPYSGKIWRGL